MRYEHAAPGDLPHLDIKGMTRFQQTVPGVPARIRSRGWTRPNFRCSFRWSRFDLGSGHQPLKPDRRSLYRREQQIFRLYGQVGAVTGRGDEVVLCRH